MTDTNSLSHSKWNCKYHIVFSPKYRRQVIYQKIKADIGAIIRKLCENKGVEIHAAEACPDHNTTAFKRSAIYGLFKGEKFTDDFRPTCKSKVQVWKQAFLVQRVLR